MVILATTFSSMHAMFLPQTDEQIVKECNYCFCDFNFLSEFDASVCSQCQLSLLGMDDQGVMEPIVEGLLEYARELSSIVTTNPRVFASVCAACISTYLPEETMLLPFGKYGFSLYMLKRLAEQAMKYQRQQEA